MSKLDDLLEIEGFESVDEAIREYIDASSVPSICMNEGCSFTSSLEPDQDKGFCEDCHTNSVKSLFILLGVI